MDFADQVHIRSMNMTIVVGRNVYIAVQAVMDFADQVRTKNTDMVLLVSAGIVVLLVLDFADQVHIRSMKSKKILSRKFNSF
jgi:hypothetical protein